MSSTVIGNKTIRCQSPLLRHVAGAVLALRFYGLYTGGRRLRACKAVWGREKWAIVLLLPSGVAPDVDESPVPQVVKLDKVPHDPHVSMAVWGAEYTIALDAFKSICGCDIHWRP